MPSARLPEMFSLRVRLDLQLYVLVFTVSIPSWAATVKAGSVSITSPPKSDLKGRHRAESEGWSLPVPAAHVGPAPAIWPCALAGNFGAFLIFNLSIFTSA